MILGGVFRGFYFLMGKIVSGGFGSSDLGCYAMCIV